MKKEFLECGKIITTHGVIGEIKVQPWCNAPEELIAIETLYFDGGKTPLEVQRGRVHKNMALLKLKGVDSVEQAQILRGKVLWARRDDFPLEEGEHFIQDLIGIAVVDADDDHTYGTLSDVSETGANDVYHITFLDGSVRLVPVIPQVVISTDIDAGVMRIRPLKGLFDDED
ncbi:MAG TPA: ribosome maturation factor RimM [Clostridia bacterium]|nr:ribosome maturation factor RimM [Clostridia bacterium]